MSTASSVPTQSRAAANGRGEPPEQPVTVRDGLAAVPSDHVEAPGAGGADDVDADLGGLLGQADADGAGRPVDQDRLARDAPTTCSISAAVHPASSRFAAAGKDSDAGLAKTSQAGTVSSDAHPPDTRNASTSSPTVKGDVWAGRRDHPATRSRPGRERLRHASGA